jgi:hypothetical protein
MILLVYWLFPNVFAGDSEQPLSIGDISFTDVSWDKNDMMLKSDSRVSELISKNNTVIIHFFQAIFC